MLECTTSQETDARSGPYQCRRSRMAGVLRTQASRRGGVPARLVYRVAVRKDAAGTVDHRGRIGLCAGLPVARTRDVSNFAQ
jgi:hypothetical protein